MLEVQGKYSNLTLSCIFVLAYFCVHRSIKKINFKIINNYTEQFQFRALLDHFSIKVSFQKKEMSQNKTKKDMLVECTNLPGCNRKENGRIEHLSNIRNPVSRER